jgi:hypothetical protein
MQGHCIKDLGDADDVDWTAEQRFPNKLFCTNSEYRLQINIRKTNMMVSQTQTNNPVINSKKMRTCSV